MCCAICLRMCETRHDLLAGPGRDGRGRAIAGAAAGTAARRAETPTAAAAGAPAPPPAPTRLSTSFFVMRPPVPVPVHRARGPRRAPPPAAARAATGSATAAPDPATPRTRRSSRKAATPQRRQARQSEPAPSERGPPESVRPRRRLRRRRLSQKWRSRTAPVPPRPCRRRRHPRPQCPRRSRPARSRPPRSRPRRPGSSSRVPATDDGTSVSTLSVEISKSGSSTAIVSPSCFSHFRIVPSTTVSPSWGIWIDVTVVSPSRSPGRQPLDGGLDVGHLRQVRVLERGRERDRRRWVARAATTGASRCSNASSAIIDGDLGARSRGSGGSRRARARATRLRRSTRGSSPRPAATIDRRSTTSTETPSLARFSAASRAWCTIAPYVITLTSRALALHVGLADRDEEVGVLGHLLLDPPVDPLVLEEHARVVVADRRLQQALRVGRERGADRP